MVLPAVQYRSVIRFMVLRNFDAKTIIQELNAAYGNDVPSQATIYFWIQQFKHGRTSVEDDERCGRPCEIGDAHLDKLKKIVCEERRITKDLLAQRLNVSYGSIHSMLQQLGIRKLCSRFVPHFLSAEMMDTRLECCRHNLALHDRLGDNLLKNIITQDESPLSLFIPDDRRASQEWKFPGERASRKLRSGTSHRRAMMLSVFWDVNGLLLIDFAPREVKLNGEYYAQLVQKVRTTRRKPYRQELYYLHDNAPIHTSGVAQEAIADTGLVQLRHPPYSPDLAPSDFWLFKHLKTHLKGKRYADNDELREAVTNFFSSKQVDFFKKAFDELIVRWRKCVEQNGSYIEK